MNVLRSIVHLGFFFVIIVIDSEIILYWSCKIYFAGGQDDSANKNTLNATRRQPSNCTWAIANCCSQFSDKIRYYCFEQNQCFGAFWGDNVCRVYYRLALDEIENFYNVWSRIHFPLYFHKIHCILTLIQHYCIIASEETSTVYFCNNKQKSENNKRIDPSNHLLLYLLRTTTRRTTGTEVFHYRKRCSYS